jgi:phospholipase C
MESNYKILLTRRQFIQMILLGSSGLLYSCEPRSLFNQGTSSPIATNQINNISPIATQLITSVEPRQTGLKNPIDTVIVLLQENHSFDSLYATFPKADGHPASKLCPDAFPPELVLLFDRSALQCSYEEKQIPNYWKLAKNFTLCDQYFCDMRTPSDPNFMMLTAAQTTIVTDLAVPIKCPLFCVDIPALPNLLDEKGLTWHDYGGMFGYIKSLSERPEISYGSIDGFYQDAAAGNLQNVIYIGSYFIGGKKDSGHPPADICEGENFAVKIIEAAAKSPQWKSMLIFLVWDEWGGFYDHVDPAVVETSADGKPLRYGYRVPCLVISPYARAGTVSHTLYSHVSILRTIEEIFDLNPLTTRDKEANSMLDCLDFSKLNLPTINLTLRDCPK